MWILWGLGVLVTTVTVIVPSWTWMFSSWQFESPDEMEPSPRRWRVVRAGAAVILVGLIAILVAAVWPSDNTDKTNAALTTIVIGDGLLIAWLIITTVSRKQAQRRAIDDANPPPNEPSSLGYTFSYLSVGISAFAILAVGLLLAGAAQNGADYSAAHSPEAHQAEIDSAMRRANDLHIQYPILDAAPATGGVIDPTDYAPVNAVDRTPSVAWDLSTPTVDRSNDDILQGADLVVGTFGFGCHVTGIVLIETDTSVTVGIAVTEEPSADEQIHCNPPTEKMFSRNWFPIKLAAPLDGRQVKAVGRGGIGLYIPPTLP